jgi:beta-phosphoglucomutase family hydrolase
MSPFSPAYASRFAASRGVLFDLDGVLTPTVDVHIRAWERLFRPYLAEHGVKPGYSEEDYYRYIDGRQRVDGVRALLSARGLSLPEGSPDDAPAAETLWGLGNRKNDEFSAALETSGVVAYPGSLTFLDAVETAGLSVAVVSSSRNAVRVLQAANLRERFPVVVDGVVAEAVGLKGKPHPDTYLHAARLLELPATACVVVEDAHSGVQAGRAGGFGFVLGVDRGVGAAGLLESGADVVVEDLAELVPAVKDTYHDHPSAKGAQAQ